MRKIGVGASTYIVVAVLAGLLVSCQRGTQAPPFPEGSPVAGPIRFQYAVFFLPKPSRDPSLALKQALLQKRLAVKIVEAPPATATEMVVCARTAKDAQQQYRPPELESLTQFSHGISPAQAKALRESQEAFILDFVHPVEDVREGLEVANELAASVAKATGGLVWDAETREMFSPEAWDKKRRTAWSDGYPDVSAHIAVQVKQEGEVVRAVTLGMVKFGLPDIVANGFPWSAQRPVENLVCLLGQAMAEGVTVEKGGKFTLNLRKLKNSKVRDRQIESLKDKASGVAYLALVSATREKGDPGNRLVGIRADRYSESDASARQEKMLWSLFGWEDSVTSFRRTPELLAASARAKARLPLLQNDFQTGLKRGEYIRVKVPFETSDGGEEWMWVEVTSWEGNRIKGILKSEPIAVPDLHAGQVVEVNQEHVFDYVRRYADGTEEGNETGRIIEKMTQRGR
jgi:uncharacterized protein YegJ (DUF2314 family)